MKKNNSKEATGTITNVYVVSSSLTENKHLSQGSASLSNHTNFEHLDFEEALRKASRKTSRPVAETKRT